MKCVSKTSDGFSMIAMIVALGIVGVMFGVLAGYQKSNVAVNSKLTLRTELEDLRRYIRMGMDCPLTKTAMTGCVSNARVALKKSSGTDFIVASGTNTVIAGYQLQAFCSATAFQPVIKWSQNGSTWNVLFNDIPFVLGC